MIKPFILSMKQECEDGCFFYQRSGTTHDEISKLLEVVTFKTLKNNGSKRRFSQQ